MGRKSTKKIEDTRLPTERWEDSIRELVLKRKAATLRMEELDTKLAVLRGKRDEKREHVDDLYQQLLTVDPWSTDFITVASKATKEQLELQRMDDERDLLKREEEGLRDLLVFLRKTILNTPHPDHVGRG